MAKAEEHHAFDRRVGDVNVTALSFRVGALEGRVEIIEDKLETNNRELAANTALTKQVHEKVEAIEQNTADIVEATKWLSTSKKMIVATFAVVGGGAGTLAALAAVAKTFGWWT